MQVRPWFLLFAALLFTLLLDVVGAYAQTIPALEVLVRDPAGYAVAGAEVKLSTAAGVVAQCRTAQNGGCTVPRVIANSPLRLSCVDPRFAPAVVDHVDPSAGTITLVLSLNGISTSIEVRASATSVTPHIANDVKSGSEITALPVWMRDLNSLAALTPGATPPSTDDDRGQGISALGSRTTFTNYQLDGVSNRENRRGGPELTPNLESVAEVQVLTSAYSAEYGSTAGPQVLLVTRSGGDRYHAKLFDYARDQAGFTFSGPLLRHQLHFFVSGFRGVAVDDEQSNDPAPTSTWLGGDFSGLRTPGPDGKLGTADDGGRVLDPVFAARFTRVEFADPNVIPAAMISPLARQLMPLIPSADNGVLSSSAADGLGRQALARLDYDVASTKLFLRAGTQSQHYSLDPDTVRLYMQNWPQATEDGRSLVLGWQRATTSLITQAHLGIIEGAGGAAVACSSDARLSAQFAASSGVGCPMIVVRGYPYIGDPGHTYDYRERQLNGDAQFSLQRGRVFYKAGVLLSYERFAQTLRSNPGGTLYFSGTYTGNAWADFLLGLPTSGSVTRDGDPVTLQRLETAAWGELTTNLSSRFTINLGARLESVPGFRTALPISVFSAHTAALQTIAAGDPVSSAHPSLEPRLGFSYRLFSHHDLVLRGGAGVFSAIDAYLFLAEQLSGNPPDSTSLLFAPHGAQPDLSRPQQWSLDPSAAIHGLDRSPRAPRVYSYTLSLEQSLGAGSLALGYNGSVSRHLDRRMNLNENLPTGAFQSEGKPVLARTYAGYGDIIYQDSGAASSYNAGQLSYTSTPRATLQWKLAYTFSRSIDNASTANDTNWLTPQYPQDIRHLAAEKGLSDFQHKHQLLAYGVLDLQRLSGRSWMRNSLLGTTLRAASGIPFTPRYGLDRPDLIGDPFAHVPDGYYFNPAAFALHTPTPQDPTYFGSLGRNSLIGPSCLEWNNSFSRGFQVRRSLTLNLRAELFNALNKMVGFPNYDLTSPMAGSIRHYQNQPRRFVAGASLDF